MKTLSYPKGFYEFFSNQESHIIRSEYVQNLTFLPHMHIQIELLYIVNGSILIQIDNNKQLLSSGSIAFIPPHKIHSFHTEKNSLCILTIFDPILIPEIDYLLKKSTPSHPFISDVPHLLSLKHYFQALTQSSSNSLLSKGYLSIILASILNELSFIDTNTQHNHTIQTILDHIYMHYQEQISFYTIATHLGISKFYISHLFNTQIGCSVPNYINYLRINLAKQLLFTDKNITEIAYECGFESLRSFYRAFTTVCNTTPRQYIKEHQE